MPMLLGPAFEQEEFIMGELLSQGVVCGGRSVDVPLSLFCHYSFQDPVLSVSKNSIGGGIWVADPMGPLGGRNIKLGPVHS